MGLSENTSGCHRAAVAEGISPSLAKRAAWRGSTASCAISTGRSSHGGRIEFLMRDDPVVLETIRHDASHVMAEAVQDCSPARR